MKDFKREVRVADHLQRELADLIRSEMRDPRIGMLAVNEVKVSRDLSYADVYVASFSVDRALDKEELVEVLNHAAGFLRTALAKSSTMRTTPKLRFHYDETLEKGAHLENLIKSAVTADMSQHQQVVDQELSPTPDKVLPRTTSGEG